MAGLFAAALALMVTAVVAMYVSGAGSEATGANGRGNHARVINVADYRQDGQSDSTAIQTAIDNAGPGDTVYFPGGTYRLDKPFHFGSGVNHVGDPKKPAILVGQGPTSLVISHDAAMPLRDTTIRGLRFDNVELKLTGDRSYSTFVNVTLADCVFENGRRKRSWDSDYLWFTYTAGITVEGCTFLRDPMSGGRGVILERTRLSVIKDSYFGTTRDLESGAPNGYFKTAINVTGYDQVTGDRNEGIVVDGNVWRRHGVISCPSPAPEICEDHGLYAWGAKDLTIIGNRADGWSNTASGGAVKVRNSEDVAIRSNHFKTSGILAYTHWHSEPRYLKRVRISENRLDLAKASDAGMGITYWRANESVGTDFCTAPGGEEHIYVTDNNFVGGNGSVHVRCADGRAFCVAGNHGARNAFEVPYVATAGCAPGDWERPLDGLHRGDFNGDGKEDFVHQVRDPKTNVIMWRGHMSAGDGFRTQTWAGPRGVNADTETYGMQVGDFNGDGRDDLAYRGVCGGDRPCWWLHHGTRQGLAAAVNYGGDEGFGEVTQWIGIHVGDYNGDGRADLLYRGRCGDKACWRLWTGQPGNRFAMEQWGDGSRWDPARTDEYGLLVGDFNGDHRDDFTYLGSCDEELCWRVQLSEGKRFAPRNWGGDFLPDGSDTAHFQIRVGDANGDGRADLAYRGRCGKQGEPKWRYHLSSPNGRFVTSCSGTYDF